MHDTHPLSRLDLNLLVYLDLLLQERSVTGAARRAGITQSAMSRALQRLRDQLKDELLVQVGRGMEPTEHGRRLESPLRDVLSRIEGDLLAPGEFEPSRSERRFRIAAPDEIAADVITAMVTAAASTASGIRFAVEAPASRDGLESGRIDLCLGPSLGGRGSIQSQKLGYDRWVVLARRGHPGIKKKKGLNLARFVEYPHVSTEDTPIDRALDEVGQTRPVAVLVPSFLVGVQFVEESDYLFCVPERFGKRLAARRELVVAELPVVAPPITVSMSWHARNQQDPAHRWLRERLVEAAAG